MEYQADFMEYQETIMNTKSSMVYKDAITEHQEAVHGTPRSFNIPRTFMK